MIHRHLIAIQFDIVIENNHSQTPRLASFKNCVGNLRDKNAVSDRHTATAALSFLVHHTGLVSIFFVQIMLRHAASFSCRSPSMMMDLRPIEKKNSHFLFLLLLLQEFGRLAS